MKIEKRLYSIILVSTALILFFILVSSTASAADALEIRGQVTSGTGDFTWTADNFAGFYYDVDDNISMESLKVSGINENVIPAGGIVYSTSIKNVGYKYENTTANWTRYPVIGFLAEEYVPINSDRADKLVRLLLDSDDRYTITTGETLNLSQGYAIEAKEIDVEGQRVWLEFSKDGEFIDDEIIEVGTGNSTWEVILDDIQNEDNVAVLRVHINQVFHGATEEIAQIEGLWLIDYANAMPIYSDDEFGELNRVSINGATLNITNEDTFTLTRDSTNEIYNGMAFKVADTPSNELRFYVMKEITEPGTYEVRGQVAADDSSWDAYNFAGFYYNLNDDVSTESLTVSGINGNVIPAGGIVYSTSIKNVGYKYENTTANWTRYPVIGFLAEEYVPINSDRADKLVRLLLDSDDRYTFRAGETLNLSQGYAIEAKEIDVEGQRVWLEFSKDGEFIDDEIIEVGTGNSTWEVILDDIQNEDNVVVLRVHINQVFQGATEGIAQIEGLWLIDYANAMTIYSDDEFGNLDDVSIQGNALRISNEGTFTLTRDSDEEIGEGMFFKIADTPASELRYYPFVERTISKTDPIIEINETEGSPFVPVANFSSNVTGGYAPLTVQFTDLSENATGWNWNFGDGTTATEQNPAHTYSAAGIYIINLISANEKGTNSKLATITVLQSKLPVANFTSNVTEGYAPLTVQFNDSSENATEISWDFGDEATSIEQSPMHTYSAAGTYTVNLTAINANGTASKSATITVLEQPVLPVADFSINVTSGYAPLIVQFTDLSENEETVAWDFNNDGIRDSENRNPINEFTIPGTYTVNLTAINANGTDSKSATIIVLEQPVLPVADFSASSITGEAPLTVTFTDKSTGSPISWSWDFGDKSISTAQNPVHTYSKVGKYTVSLTVENAAGSDTKKISKYIIVRNKLKDK